MSLRMISANLVSCLFEQKVNSSKPMYGLSLMGYEPEEGKTEDGFYYSVLLTFDLMHGLKKPIMKFRCSFRLSYEGESEDRIRLKEHIVVAHSIPYLREFVSNVTMRTEIPTLVLPPVNASVLWENYTQAK